jgi:hypothetical protein
VSKASQFLESVENWEWDSPDNNRTWEIYLKGEKIKRFKASMKLPPDRVKEILIKKYNFSPDIELKVFVEKRIITR